MIYMAMISMENYDFDNIDDDFGNGDSTGDSNGDDEDDGKCWNFQLGRSKESDKYLGK